jgi:hypothetical protein
MRMFASCVLVVFTLVSLDLPAHAQSTHVAPLSALEAAVQGHVASTDADREAVLRLLARPEVREIAGEAGIDIRRAEQAVSALDGEQLTEIAAQARHIDQTLAGGQSRVTISTTLIIIALLVLILIIVAVD